MNTRRSVTTDKHWLSSIVLAFMLSVFGLPEVVAAQENPQLTSETLQLSGKQLRKEIKDTFSQLKKTHSLGAGNIGPRVNTAWLISKYVPLGTSFKDAEEILRSAGFDLAQRPPRPARPEQPNYDRFSVRGGLTLEKGFGYKCSIYAVLSPVSPGIAQTEVKEIVSEILFDTL